MCWVIWNDRNMQIFEGRRSEVERITGIAWHRISLYLKVAWKDLLGRVRNAPSRLRKLEKLWFFNSVRKEYSGHALHELILQVPLVLPRPS